MAQSPDLLSKINHCEQALDQISNKIEARYDVKKEDLLFTPKEKIPVTIMGCSGDCVIPEIKGPVVDVIKKYDVTIVGGGIGGMTTALYLAESGYNVMLLERSGKTGGLASGTKLPNGISSGDGAAYISAPSADLNEIFKHLGLDDYTKLEIPGHIDSLMNERGFFLGLWDSETLKKLPSSFELFKNELVNARSENLIPIQPIEKAENLELDDYWGDEFIRKMPERIAKREDPESKRILKRFLEDKSLDPKDPMRDVVHTLDLFSRSALGDETSRINALALLQFYISEIEPRFTSDLGTGVLAENLKEKLSKKANVTIVTNAPVGKIINKEDDVDVFYVENGHTYRVRSQKAVLSSSLKLAPKMIENFSKLAPRQSEILEKMETSNYFVIKIHLIGHPVFLRLTYDLWVRSKDYTDQDATDYISGRYMDPKINGYEGMKDPESTLPDDFGIVTIYKAISPKYNGAFVSKDEILKMTEETIDKFRTDMEPLIEKYGGPPLQIGLVETHQWPMSINIVKKGFFKNEAPLLTQPVGHIFFAGLGVGLPSVEESLFRGKKAADDIIQEDSRLDARGQN